MSSKKASAREDAEHNDRGDNSSHGKFASTPTQINASGWGEIIKRTYQEISRDRVMAVSAGVTFYGILALFPALAAFVSLYGLVSPPKAVIEHLGFLAHILPAQAFEFVSGQIARLTSTDTQALSISLVAGLVISLWSANAGVKAIFDALNVAYGEDEKRGFFRLNSISLLMTLGFIIFATIACFVVVALPIILSFAHLGRFAEPLIETLRWPAIVFILICGLTILYRYGPSRENAKWRWISPGAVAAAVGWLSASLGLTWYMANFEDYDKTYGTVGAAIALMMWMWVSVIIIMVGAELNSESERHTLIDTTTGSPMPLGLRGADAADRKD